MDRALLIQQFNQLFQTAFSIAEGEYRHDGQIAGLVTRDEKNGVAVLVKDIAQSVTFDRASLVGVIFVLQKADGPEITAVYDLKMSYFGVYFPGPVPLGEYTLQLR